MASNVWVYVAQLEIKDKDNKTRHLTRHTEEHTFALSFKPGFPGVQLAFLCVYLLQQDTLGALHHPL